VPGPEAGLRAEAQSARVTHLLTGELAAERAVRIRAPDVGVRPLEIRRMVANGTPVEAGDPLFEFDNSQLALELEERRLAVLEAEAQLAAARSEAGSKLAEAEFSVERARATLERAEIDASIPRGIKPEEEYARLQTELLKARRSLADSERALASARALGRANVERSRLSGESAASKLRQIEGGVAALAIRAPQAGVVLLARSSQNERLWEVGDTVYPGEPLATLPDLTTLVVRARLFDVDDGAIEAGARVTVTLDPYPDRDFEGAVRTVDVVAFQHERDSSTRVFWVVVDLDEVDSRIMRPGMSALVRVRRPVEGDRVIVVSRESVDLGDLARPRVRLADGAWRTVTLGPCGPLDCVILDGITPGTALGRVRGPTPELAGDTISGERHESR